MTRAVPCGQLMKLDWICSAKEIQIWRTYPLPKYVCIIQFYIHFMLVCSLYNRMRFYNMRRACYQSSLWITSLLSIQHIPAPNEWGWTDDGQCGWLPIWMTISEAARTCSELIKCGCKFRRGCTSCKYIKTGLCCTNLKTKKEKQIYIIIIYNNIMILFILYI